MSFKHGKFSDSAVLRSLEKIAFEKGLVKEEKITKSAEQLVAERDLSSSNNLSQDIIKLCAGLRRSGLHKHADEVERNYVNYKRAQTLYEVSKEKGEDLVDFAHPEGGHVLDDVEGKHKVMTILERQQAMKKVVNKEPTGKLSVAQAIRAVKNIFAAEASAVPAGYRKLTVEEYKKQLLKEIRGHYGKAAKKLPQIKNLTDPYLTFSVSGTSAYQKCESLSQIIDPSLQDIVNFISNLEQIKYRISPGITMGLTKEQFEDVAPVLGTMSSELNQAKTKIVQYQLVLTDGEEAIPPTAAVKLTTEEKKEEKKEDPAVTRMKARQDKREQVKKQQEEDRHQKIEEGAYHLAKSDELQPGGEYFNEPWAAEELAKRKLAGTKATIVLPYTNSEMNSKTRAESLLKSISQYKTNTDITGPEFAKKKAEREKTLDGLYQKTKAELSRIAGEISDFQSKITTETPESEYSVITEEARTANSFAFGRVLQLEKKLEGLKTFIRAQNVELLRSSAPKQ